MILMGVVVTFNIVVAVEMMLVLSADAVDDISDGCIVGSNGCVVMAGVVVVVVVVVVGSTPIMSSTCWSWP